MFAFLAATIALLEISAGQHSDFRCAGGAQVFFARGSDRLDAAAEQRLSAFAASSRAIQSNALLYVGSAGDAEGAAFDRNLALRRSNAIRSILIQGGYRPDQIVIRVRSEDAADMIVSETQSDLFRIGWVSQEIPADEYARHFPNRNLECF